MSGANAPKHPGPDSITVKNVWVFKLRRSKAEICGKVRDVTILIARKSQQTLLGGMTHMTNQLASFYCWRLLFFFHLVPCSD